MREARVSERQTATVSPDNCARGKYSCNIMSAVLRLLRQQLYLRLYSRAHINSNKAAADTHLISLKWNVSIIARLQSTTNRPAQCGRRAETKQHKSLRMTIKSTVN